MGEITVQLKLHGESEMAKTKWNTTVAKWNSTGKCTCVTCYNSILGNYSSSCV